MVDRACEYLVSHGTAGAVGRFAAHGPACRRGDRVVIETARGLELGVVLGPATGHHAALMPGPGDGRVLRAAGDADEKAAHAARAAAERIFAAGRRAADELALPIEIVDVELLLDGRRAVVQHLRWGECDLDPFADRLGRQCGVEVWLDDLSTPVATAPQEHGCGKPGCGSEGACGTGCGSGGGCGTCSRGDAVDLRAYFSHLREGMEQRGRMPLL